MHGLKAQALDSRQRREEAEAQEEVGEKRPDEEAADLGRGLVLEDQCGTKPHDSRFRIVGFEAVQLALHRDLVARVERGLGPLGGPALVDLAVLGTARVGADRRGMDQLWHAGGGNGLEEAAPALDVDPLQGHRVPRGLDRPGEMDDRVGALEDCPEVGGEDVGLEPARLRWFPGRLAPRQADDLADLLALAECLDRAGPDVARRASDYYLHARLP